MKRLLCLLFCIATLIVTYAQSNAKVKEMESQRSRLEQELAESKQLLSSTQKDVDGKLAQLSALVAQIKKQKQFVNRLDADVKAIDRELNNIEENLTTLQAELDRRRAHYAHALQLMVHKNTFENRLMFILSAESFNQMIRRMRYLREYSQFQQKQGEQLLVQQKELDNKRTELAQTRKAKKELLTKRLLEKQELDRQEKEQRKLVSSLKSKQKEIRNRIARQQRERDALNKQIERIIEELIAQQRKKEKENTAKGQSQPVYRENTADKKLTGSFESNKGKLPVPLTGAYLVISHYGVNYVEGMKNVKFNNQGIDIRGQKDSFARAIFEGTVSVIYEHPQIRGSYIVMIRHGEYISAYFNLTALTIKQGDKVKAYDKLGLIHADNTGHPTMQFQLRQGSQSLNPALWINL